MEQYVLLALVVLSRCCLVYLQPCEEFQEPPPSSVMIQQGGGAAVPCGHGKNKTYFSRVAPDPQIRGEICNCVLKEGRLTGNKIIFTDITRESAGVYGCWATNAENVLVQCNFEVVVTAPPTVFLSDNDSAILEDSLTITPTIEYGVPKANITWLHSLNGVTVTLSNDTDRRVEISNEGVLTVRGVQPSDRGTYTVSVFNGGGIDEASLGVALDFLRLDSLTFKVVGNRVRVMCRAVTYPGPVKVYVTPPPNQIITDTYSSTFEEIFFVIYIYDSCDSEKPYECAAIAGDLNFTAAGHTSCSPSGANKLSSLHITSMGVTAVLLAILSPELL